MIDIFKIGGKVTLNGADQANSTIEKLAQKGAKLATSIGKGLTAVAKVTGAVVTAASTAVVAVSKVSLDAYADYEQLVGGVETLFGAGGKSVEEYAKSVGKTVAEISDEYETLMHSQQTVLDNAANAYKNAGLSANEYMETVTSFSASLLQSLGGDTQKAAEMADLAITDMADNANKMGTDMASIQNAYNGFAKQNYTMLDNLKLGYGGTKEEMQRLIDYANALNAEQGNLTEYSIESYADIVSAIHDVQEEMGITGTTAKEASSTIQGSLSAAKSAWKNLLVGFADGNQDLDTLIGNLVSSVTIAADNIVPRIAQILVGLSSALEQVIPVISAQLPGLIEKLLPGVISGAVSLIKGLVQSLPTILQILIEQVPLIVTQIGAALTEVLPLLLQTGKDLFSQLWQYIFVDLLGTSLGDVPEQLFSLFDKITPIVTKLIGKILPVISQLLDKLLPPIIQIVDTLLPPLLEMLQPILDLLSPIIELLQPILDLVVSILEPLATLITDLITPLISLISSGLIATTLVPLKNTLSTLCEILSSAFSAAVDLIMSSVNSLKDIFSGIIEFITGVFTGDWDKAWSGIAQIFGSWWEGIKNMFKIPINWIIDGINTFIRGINKVKVPDWVPAVGGKGFSIAELPKLEQGGVLEKGQVGLLEGNGAEAVVPLHQNKKWVSAVAQDMDDSVGGSNTTIVSLLQAILEQLKIIANSENDQSVTLLAKILDSMGDDMKEQIANMSIQMDKRVLGRAVRGLT